MKKLKIINGISVDWYGTIDSTFRYQLDFFDDLITKASKRSDPDLSSYINARNRFIEVYFERYPEKIKQNIRKFIE